MSELKATPGPWHPGHLGLDGKCQCRYIFSETCCGAVATVGVDNGLKIGNGGNDDPPLAEAIANMHLIAAAPELYAALEQMHSMWSAHCRANGWEPDHVAESANAIAALKKARGEA